LRHEIPLFLGLFVGTVLAQCRAMRFSILFVFLAACGGVALDVSDGGGGDSGPLGKSCPKSPPAGNDSCSVDNLECEYGSDPRWTCNTLFRCSRGVWESGNTTDPSCPTQPNSSQCPATQPFGTCTNEPACRYGNTWCACTFLGGPWNVDAGANKKWICAQHDPDCPAVRPQIGSPCATPKLSCDYGVCGVPSGSAVRCDENTGTWATNMTFCAGAK